MPEVDNRSLYLGLPNTLGRNKSVILGFIKDKSLPSYAMSVILLPLEITKEIEKCLSKFWWKSSKSARRGVIWMSWERMSKHKAAGGLGFRNFRDFNLAMLGKQAWRFLTNPDSLVSKLYKARYFADTNFLNSTLGHSPNFVWRSIFEAKNIVKAGGEVENWVNKNWDVEVVRDIFNERDQVCILDTPVEDNLEEDVLARNDLVWNRKYPKVYKVVADAKQYLAQWNAAQGRLTSTSLTPVFAGDGAQFWVKPNPNIVKMIVDAAIFADRGTYGFGLVARYHEGALVQAKSKLCQGMISPEVAEALAIKEVLSWIDNMNWSQVVVDADCFVII
ncbi:hypothetical protein AgCh_004218 [Apium graveolens]